MEFGNKNCAAIIYGVMALVMFFSLSSLIRPEGDKYSDSLVHPPDIVLIMALLSL